LQIAKAKAGIDEAKPIRVRRFPPENDRWQKLADRVMRLAGVDSRAPMLRAPHEIRETLARFGIAGRPGNVRLPPLPPLWH
jgi:protease-4